jgi:hypothetical protein
MKRNNRGAAAMQRLADWLENLGLGQYTALCNDDVSFSVETDAESPWMLFGDWRTAEERRSLWAQQLGIGCGHAGMQQQRPA